MSNPFRLDNQIALVTGGASGIGEAICRVFASAGAGIILVDLDRERAERLAMELPGAEVRVCDITDEAAVQSLFDAIPKLDVLVNNAGIGLVGNIQETSLEDFRNVQRVNVEGMFLVTRSALPLLIASHGSVINIGSVAGVIGIKRRFAYCASKGAVVALTRQLATDYPTQIRANCICPGTVDTPFVEAYLEKFHKHEKEAVRAQLHQRQPVGRMGLPHDVAYMALYLASAESAFATGSVLTIDGGWSSS